MLSGINTAKLSQECKWKLRWVFPSEVPLKKGYLNYDKNAEHVKTFSGLYRPLIVFANEPKIGKQLTDFIAEGKKHLIDWPKDINLYMAR